MRFDKQEKEALKSALIDFDGDVYLFGSKLDETKRGGDIDILLMPKKKINSFNLAMKVEARFFSLCEEKIDVVVYDEENLFCREILKDAKRINITRI